MTVRARIHRARRLRREATDAERMLWRALRDMRLATKVRWQHPIGTYVVDFAIPSRKLVIEIDGGQHATAADADASRTRELESRGYHVVRFWNSDVLGNLDGVLESIRAELGRRPHLSPTLSAPKGGEGEE